MAGILLHKSEDVNGKRFNVVSQWATPKEVLESFRRTHGVDVQFRQATPEEFEEQAVNQMLSYVATERIIWA